MSDKIKDVVKRLRDRAEARRRSGKLLQIDDRMFDLIADEIEEAAKALEADRDNWRRQSLDEDARANATHKDSLAVGDMAEMREALEEFVKYSELVQRMGIFVRDSLVKITTKAREALAKPPRNCDVGTEIDQRKRYAEMCQYNCDRCSLQHKRALKGGCELAWAQMPYESEVK